MAGKIIKIVLNQQQLELLDRTIAQGIAADREALVHMALQEFAATHEPIGSMVNTEHKS